MTLSVSQTNRPTVRPQPVTLKSTTEKQSTRSSASLGAVRQSIHPASIPVVSPNLILMGKQLDADLAEFNALNTRTSLSGVFVGGPEKNQRLMVLIEKLVAGAGKVPEKANRVHATLKQARDHAIKQRDRGYHGAGIALATGVGALVGLSILYNMRGTDRLIQQYDQALKAI